MNKTILLISPEHWEGHFVSKHHYATTLASLGYRVYFLNPPDNKLSEILIKNTVYDNLWVISAPIVAKGLRFYPALFRRWMEARWLQQLEDQIRSAFSIVWLFENSRFFDMNFAGSRLKIYHQVDSNQNFHIPVAAASADICFCTTNYIKKVIEPFNNKVFKIHHGFSSSLTKKPLSEEQRALFTQSKLNVVYIGNLDISFLDIDLLVSLIKRYPHIYFHLVGHYSENKKLFSACSAFENVIWWGKVESTLIPSILAECDIQLLLYKAENQQDKEQLANPHKVMEYLESGKITVATYTDEYKDKLYLLEMVDNSKDYESTFQKVLENLDFYNSMEKQQQRIEFAKNNSYEKQLEKISSLLQQLHLKAL
ncbi:hypothetical protein [Methylobacter sp. BlB1]|uniref:hypothetical protein n=1 Tax=Methylobacter sp. BlB1 TaxID=2785914 RepID=UPI00189347EF|nr:hypothetical protein [Methylobacter sp. BlB1]MBF6650302.1 hypothetical protein [Methylobacter sp. BlB1]